MSTFRGRLTIALVTSTAAFLSIFSVALYLWCRTVFLTDLDGDLEAIFQADFQPSSIVEAPPAGKGGGHEVGEFEVFKLLFALDGRLVRSNAQPDLQLTLPPESLRRIAERGRTFSNLEAGGELFRTLSLPVKVEGSTMVEVLGISQEPMQESLEELRQALGFALLLGIALVALISNRVAGYLTGPLEQILSQLESVTSKGDPGLRLTGEYADNEMIGLQREVNAMLERLDESFRLQRQFVSNASHELRAPLANLTLAIEVCLRRPRSAEEYLEVLRTCHGEAKRLNEMAQQLLTLSKSDEGAVRLLLEPTSVPTLLRRCLERNEARAKSKNVRLELVCPELSAELDPIKVGQVVDNLLDNALRHSPEGKPITVSADAVQEFLVIKVQDHGPGMTQEQLSRLFERFYRADPSRQRGTGGAGLGLSISQALVEAHGGRVSVESEPGRGTTVTIKMPLCSPAPACSPSP